MKLPDKLYLSPVDGRKSFYGKCFVQKEGLSVCLYSYGTKIASIDGDGIFHKHWDGFSPTTMRHINAFCAHYGINSGGKKWWEGLHVYP